MKRFSQVKGCLQLLGLKVEGLWEKCIPKRMTSPFMGQFCMGSHGFIHDTSRAEAALGTATDMPHQTARCCLWAGPRVQHLQQNTKFIPCMCKTYSAFWWLAFSPTIHHKCRLTCFAARSFCADCPDPHTHQGWQPAARQGRRDPLSLGVKRDWLCEHNYYQLHLLDICKALCCFRTAFYTHVLIKMGF